MSICSIKDCNKHVHGHGLCSMHRSRFNRHGNVNHISKAPNGQGTIGGGYKRHHVGSSQIGEHVLICEKAIGRKLSKGTEVHHVDGNGLNNNPTNLVICPNKAYHKLLHSRARALAESGNANYRKCWICKQYDEPNIMYVDGKRAHHQSCASAYYKKRKNNMNSIGGIRA